MGRTLELGRFTVDPEHEEQFLAQRAAMRQAAKEEFPGLVDVTLAKLDDGTYLDVAIWEDRRFCEAAIAKADSVPAVAQWLGLIREDVSMEFGRVVDPD